MLRMEPYRPYNSALKDKHGVHVEGRLSWSWRLSWRSPFVMMRAIEPRRSLAEPSHTAFTVPSVIPVRIDVNEVGR